MAKIWQELHIVPTNKSLIKTGAIALVIFLGLLFLETAAVFSKTDSILVQGLQNVIPRDFDLPLSFFSLLGSFEITTVILGGAAILFWKKRKVIPYSLVLFGFILLFEYSGKLLLFHPGPPEEFFRYTLPFSFPTSHIQTGFSFPSGHVSRTVFLAVILFVLTNRLIKNQNIRVLSSVFCLLFSVVMVISRIYLGEHWASDTLGGAFLGGAMGLFAVAFL